MPPSPVFPVTSEPYPSLSRTVLLLFATLLVAFGLTVATLELAPDWPRLLQMALPSELALLGATVWAVRQTGLPWRRALFLRPIDPGALLPLVLVLVGAVTVFSELYLVMQKLVPVPEMIEEALRELLGISGPVDLVVTAAVAVVAAPVLEEALFRGVILQGLARRRGPASATVWTAVLFALFHIFNPWQLLPTFFLGLVLAWVVLTTGSLLSSILVHAAFNAISLALFAAPLERASAEASPAWVVVGVVAFLLAGSLSLLAGMAWLETRTGGGWFALERSPGPAGEREAGDDYADEPAGPSTARR